MKVGVRKPVDYMYLSKVTYVLSTGRRKLVPQPFYHRIFCDGICQYYIHDLLFISL